MLQPLGPFPPSQAANASSSLDPLETSDQAQKPFSEHATDDVGWRHRGEGLTRTLILAAFNRLMLSEARLLNYQMCGHSAFVCRSAADPSKLAIMANRCHDRWCTACGRERSYRIRAGLMRLLGSVKAARLITLTVRSSPGESLGSCLDRLHDSFGKLRKHKLWACCVRGSCAIIEVKFNPERRSWHAHYHVVASGKFIQQAELSRVWAEITGDSPIVDIRLVRSEEQLARYLTKYLSKPFSREVLFEADALDEAIRTLKGRRMVSTHGEWRGESLLAQGKDDTDDWVFVDSLNSLLHRRRNGDREADAIVQALANGRIEPMGHLEWDWKAPDEPWNLFDAQ